MTENSQGQVDAPNTASPQPHGGDVNWRRQQPVALIPTQKRLDLEHSVVSIKNHGPSRHVVVDRHLVGHELQAGQTIRDVEMLNKDIEYFQRQREERFGRPRIGPNNVIIQASKLPTHPIEILDVRSPERARQQAETRRRNQEDEARREAERRDRSRGREEAEENQGNEGGRPRTRRR